MPRQARIDAPGAVHHIIARGIERGKTFHDDQDYHYFINRLGELASKTQTRCYAWALIPNHFHLLLKTGNVPIATLMRRLLTGYAINHNRRHRRSGHLFQNRYKSIDEVLALYGGPSKERQIVKGRALICFWAVRELGLSMTRVAARLKLAVPTVSVAVKRGEKIVAEDGLKISELLNIKI